MRWEAPVCWAVCSSNDGHRTAQPPPGNIAIMSWLDGLELTGTGVTNFNEHEDGVLGLSTSGAAAAAATTAAASSTSPSPLTNAKVEEAVRATLHRQSDANALHQLISFGAVGLHVAVIGLLFARWHSSQVGALPEWLGRRPQVLRGPNSVLRLLSCVVISGFLGWGLLALASGPFAAYP